MTYFQVRFGAGHEQLTLREVQQGKHISSRLSEAKYQCMRVQGREGSQERHLAGGTTNNVSGRGIVPSDHNQTLKFGEKTCTALRTRASELVHAFP